MQCCAWVGCCATCTMPAHQGDLQASPGGMRRIRAVSPNYCRPIGAGGGRHG